MGSNGGRLHLVVHGGARCLRLRGHGLAEEGLRVDYSARARASYPIVFVVSLHAKVWAAISCDVIGAASSSSSSRMSTGCVERESVWVETRVGDVQAGSPWCLWWLFVIRPPWP